MLGVQKLKDDVVIVEMVELGEQLKGYLSDTTLWEGLAKVRQTVKILIALLKIGTYNEKSFVCVEGIKERLHNLWIKPRYLIDLILHFLNTANWNFDALDKFFCYLRATFVIIIASSSQAEITLVKPAVSIGYKLLNFMASKKLLNFCLGAIY